MDDSQHRVSDGLWRLQGRINALESLMTLDIMNYAQMQPHPFQWAQAFIESVRISSNGLIPLVDDASKADRLTLETKIALDEFLENFVLQIGQLKGAPGSP